MLEFRPSNAEGVREMPNQTLRGTIIQVPAGSEPGLLFVGGAQKSFRLAGVWQSAAAPGLNQTVDVTVDESGAPVSVAVVDAQTLAKEKLEAWAGKSSEHGQRALLSGMTGFQGVRQRMGTTLMVVAAVLLIAWFFLPALSVNLAPGMGKSFTVSDVLGLRFDMGGPSDGFGFWSFLGLVAVVLPWAVPWLRARWAPWLLCAPLLMVLVAFLHVQWEIHRMAADAMSQAEQFGGAGAGAAMQSMMDQVGSRIAQAISFEFGLVIVVLASLVLAGLGIKRWLATPRIAPAI